MDDDILDKVHKLIQKAEHDSTPPAEADLCRNMADAIMRKYAIDQAKLDETRPAAQRSLPDKIEVVLTDDGSLLQYMADLSGAVARHCDCKIRHYSRYGSDGWHSNIYGFESDLRYFEILYATLRLHMLGALRPGINPAKTVAENAYILHNAGLNWFDMAKLEGWVEVPSLPGETKYMYKNSHTGERQKWAMCIGKFKQGYAEEIARRGEKWMTITPGATRTFRINAATGYVSRIGQRLREVREHRAQVGNVLALRHEDVDRMFREENPELFTPVKSTGRRGRSPKVREVPYNSTAYQSGVRQANTASLNPSATSGHTEEIPQ
jgi:hypothetical protein